MNFGGWQRQGRGSGQAMLVMLLIAGANYLTRNRLKEKGFFFQLTIWGDTTNDGREILAPGG